MLFCSSLSSASPEAASVISTLLGRLNHSVARGCPGRSVVKYKNAATRISANRMGRKALITVLRYHFLVLSLHRGRACCQVRLRLFASIGHKPDGLPFASHPASLS